MSQIETQQDLLPQYQFEAKRIFPLDSEMHKTVSKKLREIAIKLLGKYPKTAENNYVGFNENDFEFVVSDKEEPNACLITGNHNKQILCVSRGLIEHCQKKYCHEDILAAVIAHELGHYIWGETNPFQDLNGTYASSNASQEWFADIRAFFLLQEAGYHPKAMIELFSMLRDFAKKQASEKRLKQMSFKEKIISKGKPVFYSVREELNKHLGFGLETEGELYNDSDYDSDKYAYDSDFIDHVHLPLPERRKAARANLVSVENQGWKLPKGFKPSKDFVKFQQECNKIYKREGYDTYIDQRLKNEFGTKRITEIILRFGRTKLLKFFYDLLSNDDINNGVRRDDFETKLLKSISIGINVSKNFTPLLNEPLNKQQHAICEQLFELCLKQSDNTTLFKTLCPKPFGKYKELQNMLESMTTVEVLYDKQKAIKCAETFKNNIELINLHEDVWGKYSYTIPFVTKEMKGHKMTVAQLQSYKNEDINWLLKEGLLQIDVLCKNGIDAVEQYEYLDVYAYEDKPDNSHYFYPTNSHKYDVIEHFNGPYFELVHSSPERMLIKYRNEFYYVTRRGFVIDYGDKANQRYNTDANKCESAQDHTRTQRYLEDHRAMYLKRMEFKEVLIAYKNGEIDWKTFKDKFNLIKSDMDGFRTDRQYEHPIYVWCKENYYMKKYQIIKKRITKMYTQDQNDEIGHDRLNKEWKLLCKQFNINWSPDQFYINAHNLQWPDPTNLTNKVFDEIDEKDIDVKPYMYIYSMLKSSRIYKEYKQSNKYDPKKEISFFTKYDDTKKQNVIAVRGFNKNGDEILINAKMLFGAMNNLVRIDDRLYFDCIQKFWDDMVNYTHTAPYGICSDIETGKSYALYNRYVKCPFVDLGDFLQQKCDKEFMPDENDEEVASDKNYVMNARLDAIGLNRIPKTKQDIDAMMQYMSSFSLIKDNSYELDTVYNNYQKLYKQHDGLFKDISKDVLKDYKINLHDYSYFVLGFLLKSGIEYNLAEFITKYLPPEVTTAKHWERGTYVTQYDSGKGLINLFAKCVTQDYFKKLNLDDEIVLYEFMLTRGLFSEDYANQNDYIKIIVDKLTAIHLSDEDIKSSEMPKNIYYIDRLLSRRGLTEYSKHTKYETQHNKDFEFTKEREKMCEYYANYWARKLGPDKYNKSDIRYEEYKNHCIECIKYFSGVYTEEKSETEKGWFSEQIKKQILDKIATKIIAQEEITKLFDDATVWNIRAGQKSDKYSTIGDTAIIFLRNVLRRSKLKIISFLHNKLNKDELTQKRVDELCDGTYGHKPDDDGKHNGAFTKQDLILLHENFWAAPIAIRMGIMADLINDCCGDILNAKNEKTKEIIKQKKIDLTLKTLMDPTDEHYKDVKLIVNCVYRNMDNSDNADAHLAGLLVAAPKDGNKKMDNTRIGESLKHIFMAKGDAFIKFGQLLSYLPSLPVEIRNELATLRDKANIPTRQEIFDMLHNSLPPAEFNKISYVGEVLGAGSIYVSVKIKYDNKDCVIGLMRKNLGIKMQNNMELIANSILDMSDKDSKYKQLQKIVKQARTSCINEININTDYNKYMDACDKYEKFIINMDGKTYKPHVARWLNHGYAPDKDKDKDKELELTKEEKRKQEKYKDWICTDRAWKIMEMAPGVSLTSSKMSESDKHSCAKAYVALELLMLLSGYSWDTDRHAGQQNFYTDANGNVVIGIFDTGARATEPSLKDKKMFAKWIGKMAKARIEHPETKMADIVNSTISEFWNSSNNINDTGYVDSVYRGLIALSDMVEYQKEQKDENGNIVQQSLSLTDKDWLDILGSAAQYMDTNIKNEIEKEAFLSLINVFCPGWYSGVKWALQKAFSKNNDNFKLTELLKILQKRKIELDGFINNISSDIKFTETLNQDNMQTLESVQLTTEDLTEIDKYNNKGTIFGIDKRHFVKPSNDNQTNHNDETQNLNSQTHAVVGYNKKEVLINAAAAVRKKLIAATEKLKAKIQENITSQMSDDLKKA